MFPHTVDMDQLVLAWQYGDDDNDGLVIMMMVMMMGQIQQGPLTPFTIRLGHQINFAGIQIYFGDVENCHHQCYKVINSQIIHKGIYKKYITQNTIV